MHEPPAYPRIPYLAPHPSRPRGDDVLGVGARDALLSGPCVIEEKLDGSNVSIWEADGVLEIAGRAGVGSMDRGRQLGRLRAWVHERDAALRRILLSPATVIYGEWLWRTHTVRYDALPDLLVVLDVLRTDGRFASVAERDAACRDAGLATPPRVFSGAPRSLAGLSKLVGGSCFGAPAAEGLIVRAERPGPPVPRAKFLAPNFRPLSDEVWAARGVVLNALAQAPGA